MRIVDAAPRFRLAIGGFCVLYLSFALLSQANLWAQVGGGQPPGATAVLWKYHGRPDSSRLHTVLDSELPADSEYNMSQFLGETDPAGDRRTILDWVDAGAPVSGFSAVRAIVADEMRCGQCHAPGGVMEGVPLTTHAEVLPFAQGDSGPSVGRLLVLAHNHLFSFAVAALLTSLMLCFSRWGGWLRFSLISAAFLGPLLDVGGWFLTHAHGAPFHFLVMAGGALFGVATTLMAGLVLLDTLRLGVGRSPGADMDADADADADAEA